MNTQDMEYAVIVGNVGTFHYSTIEEAKKEYQEWEQAIKTGKTARANSLQLFDLVEDEVIEEITSDEILILSGWDWYEYTIAGHYLPALVNGDDSGLEPSELEMLQTFIDNLPEQAKAGHWAYDNEDEGNDFTICDVCGLYAGCYNVRLMFKKNV